MNGSDHLMPQPWLGRVVAEANDLQDDFVFEVTSLPGYLADAPTDGLTRVEGELRSRRPGQPAHGRHLQPGRREAARRPRRARARAAGRAAGRPLPAAGVVPGRLLELAWLEMVRNSAHDSICACSVDDVVDAVLHRYAEAREIADGLADRALKAFARSMAEPGPTVAQPVARGRAASSSSSSRPTLPPANVQVLSEQVRPARADGPRRQHRPHRPRHAAGAPKIDNDAWVHDVRIDEDETGIDLTVAVGTEERPGVAIAEAKQDVYTRLGARPDVVVRVAWTSRSIAQIAARVVEVPGYGWRSPSRPAPLATPNGGVAAVAAVAAA